jgi:hypothetical protein
VGSSNRHFCRGLTASGKNDKIKAAAVGPLRRNYMWISNKMFAAIQDWRIKKSLARCLLALAKLQQAFFVNYLRKDYIRHQLRYQKVLNKRSRIFYSAIIKAHDLVGVRQNYLGLFSQVNHLSEIVFSLSQLRLRVPDYSTFQICTRELEGIEKFSALILVQLAKAFSKPGSVVWISEFEEKIHSFEGIYNRTLQIVSMDPLVFTFFIQDLYALYDAMQVLNQSILLLRRRAGDDHD